MFSRPCQYAIRAMAYLGQQVPDRWVSIREIGRHTGAPLPFMAKVISMLTRRRLLSARRGPRGGVMLSHPAHEMTVGDVIEAVDGPLRDRGCVLGLKHCSEERPCPVHEHWKAVREQLTRTLHERSLAELTFHEREDGRRPHGRETTNRRRVPR